MIYSNQRKLGLSGWLKNHSSLAYETPIRLQKFLFFYEVFSKVEGDRCDFDKLRGYRNGPVFSSVWGDYTKEHMEFTDASLKTYCSQGQSIELNRAKKAAFLVRAFSENELVAITHKFNLWSSQEPKILSGIPQVPLYECDFSDADTQFAKFIMNMYSMGLIDNTAITSISDKHFVFSREDFQAITPQQYDTLYLLAEQTDLHNPVFVKIEEDGSLLVD